MSKLYVLAAGIVEAGAGQQGAVSAFVAYHSGPGESRLFKVYGPTMSPHVLELPAATTVNLALFREELTHELEPTVQAIHGRGGAASIASPKHEWLESVVLRHLHGEGSRSI